ncbi:hypothetical protein CALCODRAFT_513811 [Calocera cornea HHB12733]|uniref:Uncharacterized protein n=1 Tax=Calocera cornea HHB12733 TaxID=1353952 RepID=A0A165KBF6_9BASI|nr:hypothetical protein CALCODRAFT_513811 [Calocera cornea HHB12733]
MSFANRNSYYLRISPYTVLPLYLYLDERHTSWMTDATLQLVLEDLRHRIGPKLRDESGLIMSASAANKTKPTVDVHRGSTYQFAYFLRKADPHTLLVKRRNFVLKPAEPVVKKEEPQSPELPRKRGKGKRTPKKKATTDSNGKSNGRKRKASEGVAREVGGPEPGEQEAALPPRRSSRARANVSYADDDDEVEDEPQVPDMSGEDFVPDDDEEAMEEGPPDVPLFRPSTPPRPAPESEDVKPEPMDASLNGSVPPTPTDNSVIDFSMDPDEDDEANKPKPELQLTYQGFSIFGCALCVIVEPYPPIRFSAIPQPKARQTSLPLTWASSRSASMEPVSLGERGATPLFRPETPFDEQRFAAGSSSVDREQTPLFRLETPEPEMRGHRFAAGRPEREETPLFRLETPEPDMMRGASLAPSLRSPSPFSFGDEEAMEEDGSTIMEFSQVLSSAGAGRFGGRDDGDEEGGEGFYGDADEGGGGNM